MSDIDIDFLAEVSESGDDAPAAAPAGVDVDFLEEASGDEDPALQPPPPGQELVRARRRRRAQPRPNAASAYGKPGERTPAQHALLTAKMREQRANNRYRRACTSQAEDLVKQFNDISKNGAPSRTALTLQAPRWLSGSHKRKNEGNLKLVATSSARMAPASKLAMAYSGVHCIKSLATMFQCDPHAIEYNQRLVAVAFVDLQSVLAERVAQAIIEKTRELEGMTNS